MPMLVPKDLLVLPLGQEPATGGEALWRVKPESQLYCPSRKTALSPCV